jgi:hypothetical protein
MARISYVNSTTKTQGCMSRTTSRTRMRWLKEDAKRFVRLERAIQQCQQMTSPASALPSTPCLLRQPFPSASRTPRTSGKLHHIEKVSRRSSLPQLQEAIPMSFRYERRKIKKPRRNAFVIRPTKIFPCCLFEVPIKDDFFDSSSTVQDCSYSFSLNLAPCLNGPDDDVSLGHINDTMNVLKDGFSDLRLGDAN